MPKDTVAFLHTHLDDTLLFLLRVRYIYHFFKLIFQMYGTFNRVSYKNCQTVLLIETGHLAFYFLMYCAFQKKKCSISMVFRWDSSWVATPGVLHLTTGNFQQFLPKNCYIWADIYWTVHLIDTEHLELFDTRFLNVTWE